MRSSRWSQAWRRKEQQIDSASSWVVSLFGEPPSLPHIKRPIAAISRGSMASRSRCGTRGALREREAGGADSIVFLNAAAHRQAILPTLRCSRGRAETRQRRLRGDEAAAVLAAVLQRPHRRQHRLRKTPADHPGAVEAEALADDADATVNDRRIGEARCVLGRVAQKR